MSDIDVEIQALRRRVAVLEEELTLLLKLAEEHGKQASLRLHSLDERVKRALGKS